MIDMLNGVWKKLDVFKHLHQKIWKPLPEFKPELHTGNFKKIFIFQFSILKIVFFFTLLDQRHQVEKRALALVEVPQEKSAIQVTVP